jgi:hypothetical protein
VAAPEDTAVIAILAGDNARYVQVRWSTWAAGPERHLAVLTTDVGDGDTGR